MKRLLFSILANVMFVGLSGCGPESDRQTGGEPAAVSPQVNLGELALIENAHRKFGDKVYFDEVISPAMGVLKACGKMHPADNPSRVSYYEFSLSGAKAFSPEQHDVWAARCEFGWKPGSGM